MPSADKRESEMVAVGPRLKQSVRKLHDMLWSESQTTWWIDLPRLSCSQ